MKKTLILIGLVLSPSFVFGANFSNFENGVKSLIDAMNLLIPFFIGIGVIVFIYGIIKYVLKPSDENARTEARSYMLYGIIGLTVMFSVFGLVKVLQGFFGFENIKLEPSDLPTIPVKPI